MKGTKNKVTSLEIVVTLIRNKPYYEIKYKKVGEDYCRIGYSSFNADNVRKWYDEYFELVDIKTAEKIKKEVRKYEISSRCNDKY